MVCYTSNLFQLDNEGVGRWSMKIVIKFTIHTVCFQLVRLRWVVLGER